MTSSFSQMNNCGALGKKCPTSWSNGSGAMCKNSICQPQSCNSGYSFDYGSSQCRNLMTDTSNWCVRLHFVCFQRIRTYETISSEQWFPRQRLRFPLRIGNVLFGYLQAHELQLWLLQH